MNKSSMYSVVIVGVALLFVAALVTVGTRLRTATTPEPDPHALPSHVLEPAERHPASANHQGFLYGRVTTTDGTTHEGRLRWGGEEEAFWGNYFNGFKDENRR